MAPLKYEDLDDGDLVGLIVKEDHRALEALYGKYAGTVFSLAMQMLRDAGAAEEVTQDAFFNVWRRASSYHSNRGKVTAWLFSIAHHRAIDELRRRKRRTQATVNVDIDQIDQPSDDSTDPIRYATNRFQRTRLDEALVILRPEQRRVVELAYFGGLTHTEIAETLEQPLGTVKTRMRLALKKLREALGPEAREWADHGV